MLQLNTQCPSGCKCKWHGYEMISDKNVLNTVEVDCSNNKLSYLPINLPENTVVLNVTNNNVCSCIYFLLILFVLFKLKCDIYMCSK